MFRKILVVEDEDRIRNVTADYFKHSGYMVDVASDGEEAISKIYDNKYDIILLDVMLPKTSGWAVLKEIKSQIDTPTIMLTAKTHEDDELKGLANGAADYIKKPFSLKILHARVEKILENTTNQNEIFFKDLKIDLKSYTIYKNNEELYLPPKEFELLLLFYKNLNIVLSREKILNNIWGLNSESDYRTIDTHIKKLRKKIGNDYIKTVRGYGYMLKE